MKPFGGRAQTGEGKKEQPLDAAVQEVAAVLAGWFAAGDSASLDG